MPRGLSPLQRVSVLVKDSVSHHHRTVFGDNGDISVRADKWKVTHESRPVKIRSSHKISPALVGMLNSAHPGETGNKNHCRQGNLLVENKQGQMMPGHSTGKMITHHRINERDAEDQTKPVDRRGLPEPTFN